MMKKSKEEQEKNIKDLMRESPLVFAERILRDPNDPTKKFKAHWFQRDVLSPHGHRLNTIRAKRGSGKTAAIVAVMLWKAVVHGHQRILVIGPYLRTVQRVFEDINKHIDASPELSGSVEERSKNPFRIKFANGSIIEGQSTNVSSKRAGQAIRGWHGNMIYIDEADYLDDDDWTAFISLMFPQNPMQEPPLVYATTTPTGRRSFFWKICEETEGAGRRWKNWWFAAKHIPKITFDGPYHLDERGLCIPEEGAKIYCNGVDPSLDVEDDAAKLQMFGEQQYYHEEIAYWGDSTYSVFPKELLEKAMERAKKEKFTYIQNREQGCGGFFTLGMDFDKMQATPNICMVEYIPPSSTLGDGTMGTYVVRLREEIPRSAYVYVEAKKRVKALTNLFIPRFCYLDKAVGDVTVEELNADGYSNVYAKAFRENANIVNPGTNQIEAKPLKHVMINIAQRLFEQGRILLPPRASKNEDLYLDGEGKEHKHAGPQLDEEFIRQLMNYQVVNVTKTGIPEYTSKDEHAIDAFLLAIWAAFENFDNPFGFTIANDIFRGDMTDLDPYSGKQDQKTRVHYRSREESKTGKQTLEEFKDFYQSRHAGGFSRQMSGFGRSSF